MRLTSVTLENFRCFEKETVHLHPQLNVFVGLNASGKTALLEGIRIVASRFFQNLFGHSLGIANSDVRQMQQGRSSLLPVTITCHGKVGPDSLNCSWVRKRGAPEDPSESEPFMSIVAEIAATIWREKIDLPVMLYFSTNRRWTREISEFTTNHAQDTMNQRLAAYWDSMASRPNILYFEKEFDREQKASQQSKELGYTFDDRRLQLVRILAAKAIEDCEIFYFDYEMESFAVMFNDGRRLAVNDLSDGQKSLLLISTGIAFQCATLNPHMGLDAYNSDGVVLIDEVELHLHPDWQRQILPILTREFPNIQFICTTHSPQVLSTLKPENVQVIKDFHVIPLSGFVEGRDSNSILVDVFGIETRPKEYSEKLSHFYALLEQELINEAQAAFDELEGLWGTLDTEVVRARYYLEDLIADLNRSKEVVE